VYRRLFRHKHEAVRQSLGLMDGRIRAKRIPKSTEIYRLSDPKGLVALETIGQCGYQRRAFLFTGRPRLKVVFSLLPLVHVEYSVTQPLVPYLFNPLPSFGPPCKAAHRKNIVRATVGAALVKEDSDLRTRHQDDQKRPPAGRRMDKFGYTTDGDELPPKASTSVLAHWIISSGLTSRTTFSRDVDGALLE
jgi:hypothetical protein